MLDRHDKPTKYSWPQLQFLNITRWISIWVHRQEQLFIILPCIKSLVTESDFKNIPRINCKHSNISLELGVLSLHSGSLLCLFITLGAPHHPLPHCACSAQWHLFSTPCACSAHWCLFSTRALLQHPLRLFNTVTLIQHQGAFAAPPALIQHLTRALIQHHTPKSSCHSMVLTFYDLVDQTIMNSLNAWSSISIIIRLPDLHSRAALYVMIVSRNCQHVCDDSRVS